MKSRRAFITVLLRSVLLVALLSLALPIRAKAQSKPTLNIAIIVFEDSSTDEQNRMQTQLTQDFAAQGITININFVRVPENYPLDCKPIIPNMADIYKENDIVQIHTDWILQVNDMKLLADRPDDVKASLQLSELAENADTLSGQDLGIADAVSPHLLVYNPDMTGGVIPDNINWDDFYNLSQKYSLGIENEPALGELMLRSAADQDFTEDLVFEPNKWAGYILPYESRLLKFLRSDTVYISDASTLVNDFANGKTAMVETNTGFLAALAAAGYTGPVAVHTLTPINKPVGGGDSLSWTVSSSSQDPSDAWKVAEMLASDPATIRWNLSNGFFPTHQTGMNILQDTASVADGVMPQGLIVSGAIKGMQAYTDAATLFRFPVNLNVDQYTSMYNASFEIVTKLKTDNSFTLMNAIAAFADLYSVPVAATPPQ